MAPSHLPAGRLGHAPSAAGLPPSPPAQGRPAPGPLARGSRGLPLHERGVRAALAGPSGVVASYRFAGVLFGAQVKQAGGFLAAPRRGEAMGAEVVQLFAQTPRQWKPPNHTDEVFARFAEARDASPVVRVIVCHAPYLVNL